MSFIQGLFSGDKGANFQAKGATTDQANAAYGQTQDAIAKQNQFVDAVNAANGVGNQSQVFNQLQGVANGTGPNPAQAMLAQQTGANVAQTAAAMAGNRGAGANAGLLARQAGQAGANIQQQAVGQGATMQANQSLNALGQMGNIAGQQAAQQGQAIQGLNAATQGQQSNLLSSIGNQNQANGEIAKQNAAGQANLFSGLTGAVGSVMGLAQGGEVPQKFAQGGMTQPMAPQAVGPQAPMMPGANLLPQPRPVMQQAGMTMGNGLVNLGRALFGKGAPQAPGVNPNGQALPPGASPFAGADGQGGFNPYGDADGQGGFAPKAAPEAPNPRAALSGGPVSDGGGPAFAQGGNVGSKMKAGGKVPGKPAVGGAQNSYANDTVSAKLSPGEIVLPRSVTQSSDPVRNAAAFVQAIMARKGK